MLGLIAFCRKIVKTNKCAYDQTRKKPGGDVQAVSPAAGPAPLLGPAVNRGPEAQPDQLHHRASARGLALPGDSFCAEVRSSKAARFPRAPPSPLALPPLSGPLRGQAGRCVKGGWGGVFGEKSSAP